MNFAWRLVLPALVIGLAAVPALNAAAPHDFSLEGIEFFNKQVQPVLAKNCFSCHGVKLQQSGLRLDSRVNAVKGGDSGPAVVPGKPGESLLVDAIRHKTFNMPPDKKLPDDQIRTLEKWIEMGAPWPYEAGTPEPGLGDQKAINEKSKTHWAYQPVPKPSVPKVRDASWVKTPIDAFILAKLEEAGMKPSPPTDRRTLIRRTTFNLIGLPPTIEEVNAFLADKSPDAFAKVVDRLLASPHYGERWGRYWLDVARYADTKGYVFTEERRYPYSYTYRDWVIDAFNRDLPYDRFIVAQIAGDHVYKDPKQADELAAMGFLTVGGRFFNNSHDIINDQIDVVTRGLLGLSVACARCHDHKFDAIAAKDYYALHGVFNSSTEPKQLPLLATQPKNLNPKDAPRAMVLKDLKRPRDSHILLRGDPNRQGDVAPRRFLPVISRPDTPIFKQGSGRLELAEAIAAKDNPLTPRVMANRIWFSHFGSAIVSTPSDFGLRTAKPSHSDLLDYLARRFVDDGWSMKKLHRLILLSNTYQQRSDDVAAYVAKDPENLLYWRFNRRRLDFEAMRDSILAASAQLDRTMNGPSHSLTASGIRRRTVYGFVDRLNLDSVFRTFDFAGPDVSSPKRHETTAPQQALFAMNSKFMIDEAKYLAALPEFTRLSDPKARIDRMYQRLYARPPRAVEVAAAEVYLKKSASAGGMSPWERYSHALLQTNEFVFVD